MTDSYDPMDYSPPGYQISQARMLGWVAIFYSRVSSWPRDWTQVSCIAGRFFTNWATEIFARFRFPCFSCVNPKLKSMGKYLPREWRRAEKSMGWGSKWRDRASEQWAVKHPSLCLPAYLSVCLDTHCEIMFYMLSFHYLYLHYALWKTIFVLHYIHTWYFNGYIVFHCMRFFNKSYAYIFNLFSNYLQLLSLWQPTAVFLPGEFHEWRSLVSCSPQGLIESDATNTHTLSFMTCVHRYPFELLLRIIYN